MLTMVSIWISINAKENVFVYATVCSHATYYVYIVCILCMGRCVHTPHTMYILCVSCVWAGDIHNTFEYTVFIISVNLPV